MKRCRKKRKLSIKRNSPRHKEFDVALMQEMASQFGLRVEEVQTVDFTDRQKMRLFERLTDVEIELIN